MIYSSVFYTCSILPSHRVTDGSPAVRYSPFKLAATISISILCDAVNVVLCLYAWQKRQKKKKRNWKQYVRLFWESLKLLGVCASAAERIWFCHANDVGWWDVQPTSTRNRISRLINWSCVQLNRQFETLLNKCHFGKCCFKKKKQQSSKYMYSEVTFH